MNDNEILKAKYIKSTQAFKDLISRVNNGGNITKSDKGRIFSYLRHIPNIRKTEEELELYCKMAKKKDYRNRIEIHM